jgi:hypothetical protein
MGKYSILGNHDYGDYALRDSQQAKDENLVLLKKYHQDIGRTLLLNTHVRIEKNEQSIVVA